MSNGNVNFIPHNLFTPTWTASTCSHVSSLFRLGGCTCVTSSAEQKTFNVDSFRFGWGECDMERIAAACKVCQRQDDTSPLSISRS